MQRVMCLSWDVFVLGRRGGGKHGEAERVEGAAGSEEREGGLPLQVRGISCS